MNFNFKNNNQDDETNSLLTLYATGGKNTLLKLHDCDDLDCIQLDFNDGLSITVDIINSEYF